LARVPRLTLVGASAAGSLMIRFSRFFFRTTTTYPGVPDTWIGSVLIRIFPNIEWEMHHVFIQQAWSRVGGPNQLFTNLAANEGLRRIGNGLWNLLPIPRALNGYLGHSPVATQMLATAYYAVIAYPINHVLTALFENDDPDE
jgi:hypothetical protein